ncbi:MAG TPA: hypothetical protein VK081_13050 [Planctomycetota bacterium]|nr:hypothetical protein [Planctomycetota bacterium]
MRAAIALVAGAAADQSPYLAPYAWFHMAQALSQVGGPEWEKWRTGPHEALVGKQLGAGPLVGSWDPEQPWGRECGRIGTTALAVLLQAEYRFARLLDPRWRSRIR